MGYQSKNHGPGEGASNPLAALALDLTPLGKRAITTPRLLQGSRNGSYHVGNVLAVGSTPFSSVQVSRPQSQKKEKSSPPLSLRQFGLGRGCLGNMRTEMGPFQGASLPLLSIKPKFRWRRDNATNIFQVCSSMVILAHDNFCHTYNTLT